MIAKSKEETLEEHEAHCEFCKGIKKWLVNGKL